MKVNINDRARVVLTEAGAKHLTAEYKKRGYTFAGPFSAGDQHEDSLWSIANIFGPVLRNGFDIPFNKCQIEILEDWTR